MSYKKIVAGVATFAVAASLVAPAAFAYTGEEYTNWAKADIEKSDKTLLETAAAKAKAVEIAESKLKTAELELAAAADGEKTSKEEAVKTAKEAVKTAKDDFDKAEKAAAEAVVKAKVAVELAPAHKAANEHVERSLEAAGKLEVRINVVDLTSLAKTYEQEVRDIKLALPKLKAAVAALADYEKMAPNTKEAKARDLDKVVDELNAALSKIKDADLKAATKKDAKKPGKKLPKTGQQTPVAPFAAAGAAALIAAGLVASRKVNA